MAVTPLARTAFAQPTPSAPPAAPTPDADETIDAAPAPAQPAPTPVQPATPPAASAAPAVTPAPPGASAAPAAPPSATAASAKPSAPPPAAAPPPPAAAAPAAPATPPPPATAPPSHLPASLWPQNVGPVGALVISGYVQTQYEAHQDSSDQILDGTLLNQNRFSLRRGRMRFTRDWDYASVAFEFDGNTVQGPAMHIQKAELTLVYGRSPDKYTPPLVEMTIGQFDLPFGFDLVQSPRTRWFMERSLVSRALWPGEPDVGARLEGGISFFRYALAVTNGEPLGEESGYGLRDPNNNKDITGRFGMETRTENFAVSGGVSFNRGKGFHAGTDATKNIATFIDNNANGTPDPGEITGSGAASAFPSSSFSRWGVGADLQLSLKTLLGWSTATAEVISASNLDRGLFIADPTLTRVNVREFGYYIAFTQEITPYAIVGLRYDTYDPNADSTDSRSGSLVPQTQTIHTISPLVGLTLPDRARLIFQYDKVMDYLARSSTGVPTDFKNDQWTLRMQVTL